MREILFKAKRIEDGKWIEGHYQKRYDLLGNEEHLIFHADSYTVWEYAEINPETLCQFTGLTDKNGNKIWENDIVSTKSNVRVQIKFGKYYDRFAMWKYHQGFYMAFSDKGRDFYRNELGYWHNKIEIVGNIFDNPELVKEE
jgi:uncharacterized phage protein (TIGR01671 family)